MPNAWDKLAAESDDSYARFLVYRNLGPSRSALKAYHHWLKEFDGFTGDRKGLCVPRTWREESSAHFWVDRAAAWDVRCLQSYGARIVTLHAITIRRLARKNAAWVAKMKPGEDGFDDVMTSVKIVGAFLTPELIEGVQDRRKPADPVVAAAKRLVSLE